jgi:hypothetical protein
MPKHQAPRSWRVRYCKREPTRAGLRAAVAVGIWGEGELELMAEGARERELRPGVTRGGDTFRLDAMQAAARAQQAPGSAMLAMASNRSIVSTCNYCAGCSRCTRTGPASTRLSWPAPLAAGPHCWQPTSPTSCAPTPAQPPPSQAALAGGAGAGQLNGQALVDGAAAALVRRQARPLQPRRPCTRSSSRCGTSAAGRAATAHNTPAWTVAWTVPFPAGRAQRAPPASSNLIGTTSACPRRATPASPPTATAPAPAAARLPAARPAAAPAPHSTRWAGGTSSAAAWAATLYG